MTPLVLLPGMMCDDRLFALQIQALHGRGVMVLHIGGHDNMTDLAAEILRAAPPQFILGGLSMGGIVAMEVLRLAPKRIEGLILMDTNPLAEAEDIKARRQPQIDAVKRGELEQVMCEQLIPNYLHSTHPHAQIEALCLEMAVCLGKDVFVRQSCALRDRRDQTQTLASYTGPALVLQGEDDRLCPVHRHELMHELMPQSRYVVIKNAGHLPVLEQPEHTNEALTNWLMQAN